jgi:hypothetical protein
MIEDVMILLQKVFLCKLFSPNVQWFKNQTGRSSG